MPLLDREQESDQLIPGVSSPFEGKRLTMFDHVKISSYWFGSNLVWGALLGPVMAEQMTKLVPARSADAIANLYFFGAFPALVVPLVIGAFSDRCTSPFGRRRPFMLAGGLLGALGILGMYLASTALSFPGYLFSYIILQIGSNTALASYMGIIPDLVPKDQRGVASGYMAFMSQASTMLGVFGGGELIGRGNVALTYSLLGGGFLLFLVLSILGIKENPLRGPVPKIHWGSYFRSLVRPLVQFPDFRWVWITRALMMLGFYAIQPYILYYLRDVTHVSDPAKKAGIVLGIILLGATVSGVVGGALSDRVGRKPVVYGSSIAIAAMSFAFIFCNNLQEALLVGMVFGLGYGAYISVDWALGTDVLPAQQDAGKDMSIWHVAMTLPQQLAALMAGKVLQQFAIPGSRTATSPVLYAWGGYAVIFTFAAVCFILGAYLLRNVRGAR